MEPITLQQIAAAVRGRMTRPVAADRSIFRISLDSRTVAPGELFWAVRGNQHDGHAFASEALERGAVAAVVAAGRAYACSGPAIIVEETHQALANLARWYRNGRSATVIGVTGSVGKTTTRELIHTVLSVRYPGMQSPQNFNNHFGVPLSLLKIQNRHRYAVLELGASAPGEVGSLASMAAPEIGVVTAVAPAHLESFGSLDAIEQAKGELIEALPQSGLALLAGDNPRVRRMSSRARCKVTLVGEQPHNDCCAINVTCDAEGTRFTVDGFPYRLPAIGRHLLGSALCGIAIAREWGMNAEDIQRGFDRFVPVAGRCRVECIGDWTVIDDTYNASPDSMAAACGVLRDWRNAGRTWLIAGDMLELGDGARQFHRELGEQVAMFGIDRLVALGEYATDVAQAAVERGMDRSAVSPCRHISEVESILAGELCPGDVILVKGSRGLRMERVIEWLRRQTVGQAASLSARAA